MLVPNIFRRQKTSACVAFLNPDEVMIGMQGKRIGDNKVKLVSGSSQETSCIWVEV